MSEGNATERSATVCRYRIIAAAGSLSSKASMLSSKGGSTFTMGPLNSACPGRDGQHEYTFRGEGEGKGERKRDDDGQRGVHASGLFNSATSLLHDCKKDSEAAKRHKKTIFALVRRARHWGQRGKSSRTMFFSLKTPRQHNFESANFIVEKFNRHCAGS